jgi:hypothetical protein
VQKGQTKEGERINKDGSNLTASSAIGNRGPPSMTPKGKPSTNVKEQLNLSYTGGYTQPTTTDHLHQLFAEPR